MTTIATTETTMTTTTKGNNDDDDDNNNNGNNNDDNDNGRGIISTSQDFHQKSLRGFGLKILKTIFFLILANFFLFFSRRKL